ncbi:hypothetical protein [Agromyces sp. ZXT2-6]|uniref:hypothetical protein n=1 Tax=Agromyces sp. ZXT2-6 TaxID=3461153 RepID=UPI004054E4CB
MSTSDVPERSALPTEPARRVSGRAVRRAAAVLAAVAAVVAIALGVWTAQSGAERRHATAVAAHAAAAEAVTSAQDDLEAAADDASAVAALAKDVGDLPDEYVGADAGSGFADAAAEVAEELDEAEAIPEIAPEVEPGEPGADGPRALDDAAERLDADAERLQRHASELDSATNELQAAAADTDEAADEVLAAIPLAAEDLEAEYESARNLERLALREATALVGAADDWNADAVDAVVRYLAAADALVATHAAEEAEKAGPLYDRRKEVEAFARELANGVLLEFDWAPTVSGFGMGGTYGGSAVWDVTGGGIATIGFSDSVAELWDAPGVRALVAHEVGHAMTGRCHGEIVSDQLAYVDNEAWATAWAISMGYTGDGSGEWLYGRPSDELIDLAARCR